MWLFMLQIYLNFDNNNKFQNKSCMLYVLIDVSLMTKTSQTVQQALSSKGFCDFQSKWVLLVTWHNVSTLDYTSVREVIVLQGVSIACYAEPCISDDRVVRTCMHRAVKICEKPSLQLGGKTAGRLVGWR